MSNSAEYPKPTMLRIEDLLFDPHNPRIPTSIEGSDESETLKWMLEDAGIFDLMNSIGQQGYFSGEPLLVIPNDSGKYLVVEGNRRLAALKLLRQPSLTKFRQKAVQNIVNEAQQIPDEVPVIIYEKKSDVLDYLGFRHVTGIKSWGPLAKARYLNELADKYAEIPEQDRFSQLAKIIGSRTDYVRRMLAGLKLYEIIEDEGFYGIQDLDEETISFSLITTALANSHLVDFLGLENAQDLDQAKLDHDRLQELTKWIFEKDVSGTTRLGESRNFRHLNRIVADSKALSEFRSGRSLEEALIFTDLPVETFRTLLREAKDRLADARNQLYLISEGLEERDLQVIQELTQMSRDLSAVVRSRVEDVV